MGFGSLGMSELLVIFVVVLVFFGPKRMPEVARSLGSAMREFRRSLNQIQRELEEADPTRDLRKETKSILSQLPEQVRPSMPGSGSPQQTGESPGPPSPTTVKNPPPEPTVTDPQPEPTVTDPQPEPSEDERPSETGSESG